MSVYLDILGRWSLMFPYVLRAEELTSFVPGCLCKAASTVSTLVRGESKGRVCMGMQQR